MSRTQLKYFPRFIIAASLLVIAAAASVQAQTFAEVKNALVDYSKALMGHQIPVLKFMMTIIRLPQ